MTNEMGSRKGQGAAEYLVLLAVVLIVAMIGIVLLGGFSSTGGDAREMETRQYWASSAPFAINDWTQINSTLYVTLVNRENNRLILRQMIVGNVTIDFGAGWTMGPQAAKNISIAGFQACNLTSYDSFSYDVKIAYDSENIANRTQSGTKPLTGRCAFS